ncbi:MAG TPA: hypothetical protein DEQ52_08085 [Ruminococcaceae bacterium]|nr:hypothetical protein [Oscillospiraceae bacterium]
MSTYNSRAAVQSIMAIAESENSKPGRVTMPKVFLGVGIFDVIAMGVGIYFSLRFKEILPAVIFSILALLGIFLIIGYFNQRIYYSSDKFVSSNFWGVKRTYSYGEITGIMGYGRNTDVKIYIGDKKIAIDRMAVGKKEFIEFALKRHRELKHKNIPLLRAAKKKDLFNGNIANPGEFIAVYIIIAVGVVLLFGIMIFLMFQTPSNPDIRYSAVTFDNCKVSGKDLQLRVKGDLSYKINYYDEVLPNADAFLAKYKNGGILKLGYQRIYSRKYEPDYYKVYYVQSANGEILVTPEKTSEVFERHSKEDDPKMIALLSVLMLFLLSFIPGSIYAGRHADTLNPKIVRIFFKPDCILCSGGSAPKRKRRGKK